MTKLPSVFVGLLSILAISSAAGADGLPRNWPMAPAELEARFAQQDFRILEVKGAGSGVTGASKLKIQYPDGKVLKVKWKAVPPKTADGWNNSPRKELAAYEIQRWLVDENDFMVPTLAPHCLTMEEYKPISATAKPSLSKSSCALGVVAVWLDDVTAPKPFYDAKRFARDPLYARYMADFNLLTYLVDHRDGRQGNLLLSSDAADPRVYAVDNGIAFEPLPWNFLVPNWNKIRVPWLRRETVERLRKVDKDKLDALGVVAELEADASGVYQVVAKGPNIDDDIGVRRRDNRIQFGLTEDEIEEVQERIKSLLKKVDSGKQPVR